jgi:hypothetical protein
VGCGGAADALAEELRHFGGSVVRSDLVVALQHIAAQ